MENKKEMENKKDSLPEKDSSETKRSDDNEDLLYTHKPETRGNEMRWNNSLCRKPGR